MRRIGIAIVGGGPAGLTAGLYASRGGVSTLLFEEMFPGGQIVKTHRIENYPGCPDSPDGYTLAAAMEKQAAEFGLETVFEAVSELELSGARKQIKTAEETYEADAVILCMGASPRKLGLPGEEKFTGAGVSYCATCDGAFFRGKTVAVAGGGDTAVSDALYLSTLCRKVYVIHRREQLRAGAVLQKTAFEKENIEFIWNSEILELLGEDKLLGLRLKNKLTDEKRDLYAEGLFVAVGIEPRTELAAGKLPLDKGGFLITDSNMETAIPGVFAAGDIRNTPLRQVVTACADGAIAATKAIERIGQGQNAAV